MTDQPSRPPGEPDPLLGRTISGRYRVHRLIGRGGMGKVFEAQQIPLGRAVALKILEADRVGPEFHQRFFQEAAILAKLASPHTVTIYDYGRDGDVYFIAMELIDGVPLDELLRREGSLPPARALGLVLQICRSLREAHQGGIVHRDLKPANVLVERGDEGEERVKVLDFGLAKRLKMGGDGNTQRDTVPGSPKYMAPEVIRQEPIDARADLYGLGVLLYQMLAGKVPFDRPNPMDILIAHVQEQPPPLRITKPDYNGPPALEHLVMRLLSKQPERRFASAQELIDALRTLMAELGLMSDPSWAFTRPPGPLEPAGQAAPTSHSGAAQRARALRLSGSDVGGPPQAGGTPAAPESRPRLRLSDVEGGGRSDDAPPVSRIPLIAFASVVALALGAGIVALTTNSAPEPAGATNGTEAAATPPQPVVPPPVAPDTPAAPAAPEGETATEPAKAPASAVTPTAKPPAAKPKPAAAKAAAPTPAAATPAAKPSAEPEPKGQVPSIEIEVTSQPSGAQVAIGSKKYGKTPTTFTWHDAKARKGEEVVLKIKKSGYREHTIRRPIQGPRVEIDVKLEKKDSPVKRDEGVDLKAIEQRARDLVESVPDEPPLPDDPGPILQVKPSD